MRVLVYLALLGAAVAVPTNPQRIVGGEPTTVEKYPYMANMQYLWFGVWFSQACGGSLLTTRTIVSAAYCYLGDPVNWWHVRLGTSQADSGGTIYDVQRIAIHEGYTSQSQNNDVAIVWLSTDAILGPAVATVRLAGPNYFLPDSTLVTTIGWGRPYSGGIAPDQLQEVDINIINQSLCVDRYKYLQSLPGFSDWPDVTPQMICAGILDIGGKDACQGDSGGPLVHNHDVLVGIVSWRRGCADPFYPGVNARVSALVDWIVANAS